MIEQVDVAVVGATGLVGQAVLKLLEERQFPLGELYLLASDASAGETYTVADKRYTVQPLPDFDFSRVLIAFFCVPEEVSGEYAMQAAAAGAIVIDSSAQHRNAADIPLVIPEINPDAVEAYTAYNIISCPASSTVQMLLALNPIHQAVGIERVNAVTFQAVSGKGRAGIEELSSQAIALFNLKPIESKHFSRQIAFNLIPQIGEFGDDGYTREELQLQQETQKILQDADILIDATAVQAPVFYGHSQALTIETKGKMTIDKVRERLIKAEGVTVMDVPATGGYPTATSEAAHENAVFVGRIRSCRGPEPGLHLWVVADNVLRGAAQNSVGIAEILVKGYL
jgi:aspartate-semialdehyde dehydrogenase